MTGAVALGTMATHGRAMAGGLFGQEGIRLSQLPAVQNIWKDVEFLSGLGPRYCGNDAHNTLMNFLDEEFEKCGMTLSDIPHTSLMQWLPRNVTLRSRSEALPVGAFCRWSAQTGPRGVTAPICYLGRVEGASRFSMGLYPERRSALPIPPDVRGKIALVEITVGHRPLGLMFKDRVDYMFDKLGRPMPPLQGPSASNMAATPDDFERKLKEAGAVGLIYAWRGLSDADAKGQSRLGTEHLPSIWVIPTTGAKLIQLAQKGEPVTLTVEADTQKNAPTRTIVATLPGATEESIILWTHTDGPNALQENGSIALLNMMRYYSKIPRSERRRTIKVVIPESHFAEQYISTSAWITERPDLVENSVALIAAEHLGGTEWLSDPISNTYTPTGELEVAFAFCPTAPMRTLAKQAVADQAIGREVILNTAEYAFTPGIAAYRRIKMPSFAYISIPSYLMADDGTSGHLDKLSPTLWYEQFKMLTRLLHAVDATPAATLRQV